MKAPLLALLLSGCGWFQGGEVCESGDDVLAEAGGERLTCLEAGVAAEFVEILAGRAMDGTSARQVRHGVADRFEEDPAATRGQLAEASAALDALREARGLEAAELRSEWVYRSITGEGPFGTEEDELRGALERTAAVWTRSDEERLALTEVDIEGWILYGSLCREVQGAGPLRLSVADRVTVYRMVQDAFTAADREGKIAAVAVGPFWPSVQEGWAAAPYERQQAWIARAPLPPPMTATSKGYMAELLGGGGLDRHAATLHEVLGPFTLSVLR